MNPDLLDIPLGDLDESQFQNFFADYMGERGVREQTVVKGRVINILDEWVVVDINYKAEGYVPREEFTDSEGQLTVKIGDDVDVFLPSMKDDSPALILSKEKADLMKAWDEISKAVERDEVVSGQIVARVKGGLSVNIGVKAFLPGSQVDLRPVKNLDKFIGETLQFKIIKFNKKRGNIVLSRRVLLEQERAEKREETLKRLQEGVILTGVVKNITDSAASTASSTSRTCPGAASRTPRRCSRSASRSKSRSSSTTPTPSASASATSRSSRIRGKRPSTSTRSAPSCAVRSSPSPSTARSSSSRMASRASSTSPR